MIKQSDLDYCIKHKKNIIFEGKAGIGKTAVMLSTFRRHYGEDFLYFSASTMDPWTDLIGVPQRKEVIQNGQPISVLEFVKPEKLALAKVRAIAIDEFNRAPKKVKNCLMEAIQFKTINGVPIPNLEVVWAAINPFDDDEHNYDVEEMDQAQLDRFHLHVKFKYTVDPSYFSSKYGSSVGNAACSWWMALDQKKKFALSPRRLDAAVEVLLDGGPIEYVIPAGIDSSQFAESIKDPIIKTLTEISKKNDKAAATKLLTENAKSKDFMLRIMGGIANAANSKK